MTTPLGLYGTDQRSDHLRMLKTDSQGNLCVTTPITGFPFHHFLTLNGDGSTINAVGNYSVTPAQFTYTVVEKEYHLKTLVIGITDASKFLYDGYGGMAALTNGVSFSIYQAATNTTVPLLGGFIIHNNYEWYSLTPEITVSAWDLTPQTLSILIDAEKKFGTGIFMKQGDKFIVNLHDDFTGLVSQTFALGGISYYS